MCSHCSADHAIVIAQHKCFLAPHRKSASSATWRPEKGAAEVFEQRGKLLMRMGGLVWAWGQMLLPVIMSACNTKSSSLMRAGFIHQGKIHIHIEEAV